MKSLFWILALVLLHGSINAQDEIYVNSKRDNKEVVFPRVNGVVQYDSIYNIPGIKKDELFHRAQLWVVQYYKSANDVIQLTDKDNGIIILKGVFLIPWRISLFLSEQTHDAYFRHTLTIRVKDERVKVEINNFNGKIKDYPDEVPIDAFRPNKWERRTNFPDLDKQVRKAMNDFGDALHSSQSEW